MAAVQLLSGVLVGASGCVEHPFNDPNCQGSGPDRQVSLCTPSSGRSHTLEPRSAASEQRFVFAPLAEAPEFFSASEIPSMINGETVDDFMAAHPRGFGTLRFADLDGDGDLDIVRGARLGNYSGANIFRN